MFSGSGSKVHYAKFRDVAVPDALIECQTEARHAVENKVKMHRWSTAPGSGSNSAPCMPLPSARGTPHTLSVHGRTSA
ncbi:hypothetical protein AURDEDRAFT_114065 [Auricularia subglabra TFB-10046 SS5]|nr:hypothetical protein AURDEDRAFT_114065 [Auricularia subglabra TFB-10046 SS5]